MINRNGFKYQLLFIGISLFSYISVLTNFYLLACSNIVGIICFIDIFLVKKKDMFLHHILVFLMTHFMNNHYSENIDQIISVILSTETSTIFLTADNLIDNTSNMYIIKNINRFLFVSTFFYYRIYNYAYYLVFDKNIYNTFFIHSKNFLELCEIFISVYGLFILNIYWFCLVIKKMIKIFNKNKPSTTIKQNM